MQGNCENVICQICNKEMSFGRIKRHVKARHKEIPIQEYINKFYQTLPDHHFCIICNKNIVWKYQTCSKECHGILTSSKTLGVPKPEGFSETLSKATKGTRMGRKGEFTGFKHSEESKKAMSKFREGKPSPFTGHHHTEESKQQSSKTHKEFFARGDDASKEALRKIFGPKRMNKLEELVFNFLQQNNIEFQYQFFLRRDKDIRFYDFKIKDKNILLEIDGDYYHGNPNTKKHFFRVEETKLNDAFKDQLAKDNNYKLIRIWESDIKKNPNIILTKLQEVEYL